MSVLNISRGSDLWKRFVKRDRKKNQTVLLVNMYTHAVITANSTPAFSSRLDVFLRQRTNFDFTPSTFSPHSTKQEGAESLHLCMTKYYSLMGKLAASTAILAVNVITPPPNTVHRDEWNFQMSEPFVRLNWCCFQTPVSTACSF